MNRQAVLATLPFALLVPVLRQVPLPPSGLAPLSWPEATGHAVLLLVLMAAHSWCYARWQPAAPRRILANELLTRLWFVGFWILIVQGHTPNGIGFAGMALPWAALTWEVHRQDVKKRGYQVSWNVANLGLFLLGLALMGLVALRP